MCARPLCGLCGVLFSRCLLLPEPSITRLFVRKTEGNITSMAQAQPKLPMELMLELMDQLLVRGDTGGAAHLAQSCRTLRSSETGRRAQYLHALASHSMSVPELLPSNLEYETEVLLNSHWPHQAPPHDVPQSARGLDQAFDAILRGNECFTLSENLKTINCFIADPKARTASPAQGTTSQEESFTLRKSFTLDCAILAFTVDEVARTFAAAYDPTNSAGRRGYHQSPTSQLVEVRCLETGAVLAELRLGESDGYNEHDEYKRLQLLGDYILLRRGTRSEPQLRRWRGTQLGAGKLHCPVLWTLSEAESERFLLGVELHAPCFLSVQMDSRRFNEQDIDVEDPAITHLQLYHLDQDDVNLLVTLEIPEGHPVSDLNNNYLKCGARLAPGEDGLVVVAAVEQVVGRTR